ncbi:MAG TPA: hypothetical protein VF756_13355 [Thermoanaerobaculia bacterium]
MLDSGPGWLYLLFGGLLLLAGQRLFWLFVGVSGFLAGLQLAMGIAGPDAGWLLVVLPLAGGLLGAGIALFLPRLAAGLAGFWAGALVAMFLFPHDASLLGSGGLSGLGGLLVFVLGLAGAVMAVWLLDPALVLLSSFLGAAMIANALPIPHLFARMLTLSVLTVIGAGVQWANVDRRRILERERRRLRPRRRIAAEPSPPAPLPEREG